jgi:hypothetical protein
MKISPAFLIMTLALCMGIQSRTVKLNTPHESLSEGFYFENQNETDKVYVYWQNDTLLVIALEDGSDEKEKPSELEAFTLKPANAKSQARYFPNTPVSPVYDSIHLVKKSMDLEFLTILFKYRPPNPALPGQLNTDLI